MQQEAYIWSTAITCLFCDAMLLITLARGAPQDPILVYFMSLFSRIKGSLSPNMGAEKEIMSPRAGNVGNNDQPPAYTQ